MKHAFDMNVNHFTCWYDSELLMRWYESKLLVHFGRLLQHVNITLALSSFQTDMTSRHCRNPVLAHKSLRVPEVFISSRILR